jgi:glycerophosphoryl diester phosphodiesterase
MKHLFSICIVVLALCSCGNKKENKIDVPGNFDWQGHRGARGKLPENTVPAFLKSLEYPVTTLELDVVISKDHQVVVSHEPWISAEICIHPKGFEINEGEKNKFNIFRMKYEEISQFDCGSIKHPRFPEQEKMQVSKPTLRMVVEAVKEYCELKQIPVPGFNIELKANPEWDNIFTPSPGKFTALVLQEIDSLGITEKTCIQSFDVRILQEVKKVKPEITQAFLVEDFLSLEQHLEELGHVPDIFSPFYGFVTKELVSEAKSSGMKVIPWTVNDVLTMRNLIEMGVDGIITDYPNLIEKVK